MTKRIYSKFLKYMYVNIYIIEACQLEKAERESSCCSQNQAGQVKKQESKIELNKEKTRLAGNIQYRHEEVGTQQTYNKASAYFHK